MTMKTILLIDDSFDDSMMVRRILHSYDLTQPFQLVWKQNLAAAAAYLEEYKDSVGLILLDLSLPDAPDYRGTFAKIKQSASDIPVVILTDMEDLSLAVSMVSEGAADFINKSMISQNPRLLCNIVEFSIRRNDLVQKIKRQARDSIRDREMAISYLSGGYLVQHSW